MKSKLTIAAGIASVLAGIALVVPVFLPHHSSAQANREPVEHAMRIDRPNCAVKPIPPMSELTDVLGRINTAMVHLVEQYETAVGKPLPAGVTREKLAEELRGKLSDMQHQMNGILDDSAARVEGKTEGMRTVGPISRPCR